MHRKDAVERLLFMVFKNWSWFISGICTMLLFLPVFSGSLICLAIFAALLLWTMIIIKPAKQMRISRSIPANVFGALFIVSGCGFFYLRFFQTQYWIYILLCSIALGLLSSWFVLSVSGRIFQKNWTDGLPPARKRVLNFRSCLFILICTLGLSMIYSASSFLYSFNPYAAANAIMSGARSALAGHNLYQDLYLDQAPLMYWIHQFSWKFFGSFHGVYLIEVLADALFFIFALRCAGLYVNVNKILIALPITAFIFFSSRAFGTGDTAAEFAMPFLACSLYLSLKILARNRLPGYGDFFIMGICLSFVIWLEFPLAIFCLLWIVIWIITYLVKGQFERLFVCFLCLLLGISLLSIPVVLSFYLGRTLDVMIQSYFVSPLCLTSITLSSLNTVFHNICARLIGFFMESPLVFTAVFLSFVCTFRLSRRLFWQLFITSALTVTILFGCFYWRAQYALFLNLPAVFSIILFYRAFASMELIYFKDSLIRYWMLLICLLSAYYTSEASGLLSYQPEDFPQMQYAAIFAQRDNPSVLNFGIADHGFYTASGLLPSTKYFSMETDQPEIYEEQKKLVQSGLSDFVITCARLPIDLTNSGKYALIKSTKNNSPDGQEYYLYVRQDLLTRLSY